MNIHKQPITPSDGETKFRPGNPVQSVERNPVAVGESREAILPQLPRDRFYLTEAQKAQRGLSGAVHSCVADLVHPPGHPSAGEFVVPGDRVLVAVTPPAVADHVDPFILTQKELDRPSFQLAKDKNGNCIPATNDLVWATYDRDEYLNGPEGMEDRRSLRHHNEAARAFTDGVVRKDMNDVGAGGAAFKHFTGDERSIAGEHARAKRFMQGEGKSVWPKEMSLQEIQEKLGPEKILREERKYARGGRSERPQEYEQWEEKQREIAGKRKERNKSFSFPGSTTK